MKKIFFIVAAAFLASCSLNDEKADAYGNFEAEEILIPAEAGGKLLMMTAEEGTTLDSGVLVALTDTTEYHLKRLQLQAQKNAVASRSAQVFAQIEVYRQQKENLLTEKKRVEKMLAEGAATSKQADDINGNISVVEKQILSIETQNASVVNEMAVVESQLAQAEESIRRCYVHNPLKGTVLSQYVKTGEMAVPGKPLYKIADLENLILRVFVSGEQLAGIRIGQKVKIFTDGPSESLAESSGEIVWIASEAEFTPKIIQTKEERVNLVYAVKIKTPNDGRLKIGMPAEVIF